MVEVRIMQNNFRHAVAPSL